MQPFVDNLHMKISTYSQFSTTKKMYRFKPVVVTVTTAPYPESVNEKTFIEKQPRGHGVLKNKMIKITGLTLLIAGLALAPGHAIERGQELAGDQETISPKQLKSIQAEPERDQAGAKDYRPTLKLPEVIVTGEKQYQVSAEKKELLEIDPMKGTKQIPDDLDKVNMPGLTNEKDSPQMNTASAKDYLLQLETGAGFAQRAWGELITGYEAESFDLILVAHYDQQAKPESFHFIPFDQEINVALDSGVRLSPAWKLSLDVEMDSSGHKNPNDAAAMGNWLHDQVISGALTNHIRLSNHSSLSVVGRWGHYRLYAGKWHISENTLRESVFFEGLIDLDMTLSFIKKNDLNVLVHGNLAGQTIREDESIATNTTLEETYGDFVLRTRFQPLGFMAFDLGVKLNQFNQADKLYWDQSVVGNLDIHLPWYATLYLRLDGGLDWIQAHELLPEHHRILSQSLTTNDALRPVQLNEQVAFGWRQKISNQLVIDLSWTKRHYDDYIIWTNDLNEKLAAYQVINNVMIQDVVLNVNYQTSEAISLEASVTMTQAGWESNDYLPYYPQLEATLLMAWKLNTAWTVAGQYHYLGSRKTKVSHYHASLAEAHLLDLKINYSFNNYLDFVLELENLLDYQWEDIAGYRENGLTIATGIRITL